MSSNPSREVDVQVFPAFARRVSRAWLRKVAEQALQWGGGDGHGGVSLVIADDETVRGLNREYRNMDETTDVLAFSLGPSQEEDGPAGEEFPLPPGETPFAGEVVVSYPQAARQAREGRRTIRSEIALLVVHGVLHLMGYDHADPEEQGRMWAKQDEVLARVPAK